MPLALAALLLAAAPTQAAPPAGPLSITTRMMVEQRIAAADGTTRIRLVPATRVVPGDRVTVVVAYRNTGRAPIANLVLANPVPPSTVYRGPAAGSPAPDLVANGSQVRWRLSQPVAPGSGGELGFTAVVR
jgi:uncharacterized repeat protein (TIGR01451 family)